MPLFDWIRSDLHNLNLDWIISKIRTVEESEQGAFDAAADANASKTAAASSATAANNSKNAAAGSATLAAVSAQQAQNLVDQLDTTIAQDVSDWLENNLTPTSPPVDDTLTIQGAAADAKKTGDEISDLKTKIDPLVLIDPNDYDYILGMWYNGQFVSSTTRIGNRKPICLNSGDKISISEGSMYVETFNSRMEYQTSSGWVTEYTVQNNNTYVGIDLRKGGGDTSDITPEQIPVLVARLSIFHFKKTEYIKALFALDNALIDNNSYYNVIESRFRSTETHKSSRLYPVSTGDIIEYALCGSNNEVGLIVVFNKRWEKVAQVTGINTTTPVYGTLTISADGYIIVCNRKDFDGYLYFTKLVPDFARVLDKDDNLPSYWETYMQTKLPTIKNNIRSVGATGDNFVFITDVHVPSNYMQSPKLIKHIMDNTTITSVICGGDIVISNDTAAEALNVIDTWNDAMPFPYKTTVKGNHDTNYQGNELVTDGQFYASILKNVERFADTEQKVYYVVDNISQKIRYIYLDTDIDHVDNMSNEQIAWMVSKINELEEGWSVLIVMHIFFIPSAVVDQQTVLAVSSQGNRVMTALDNIYDTCDATIIGIICGHCHRDYYMQSVKGYPIISTTCDAGKGQQASGWDIDNPTRVQGTTSEQAFDVYSINTATRTIKIARVGIGNDRTFTY